MAHDAYTEHPTCGATYVTGGNDPYSTECDLQPHGPEVKHLGHDPIAMGGAMVEWRGGGMCAGDPLPVTDVRWLTADEMKQRRHSELLDVLTASHPADCPCWYCQHARELRAEGRTDDGT